MDFDRLQERMREQVADQDRRWSEMRRPLRERIASGQTMLRWRWMNDQGLLGPWGVGPEEPGFVLKSKAQWGELPAQAAVNGLKSVETAGWKGLATRGAVLAGVGLLGYAAWQALHHDSRQQQSWAERVQSERSADPTKHPQTR